MWIYYLLAGITGLAIALMEFYVRFLPAWRTSRAKKQETIELVGQAMEQTIDSAKKYEYIYFRGQLDSGDYTYELRALIGELPISKKLSKKLGELEEKLAAEYNEWLFECLNVVRAEIGMHMGKYPILEQILKDCFGTSPENVLDNCGVCQAVLEGYLTFEKAREAVLRDRWETQVKVKVPSGEEKTVLFKDFLEGSDFHSLVKKLTELQERKSIKELRAARSKFLEKAQLILREVS
ncbi:MAG: hypothetical protein HYX84_00395 [Chloroflexi bacterium]|nr:hypothetical protein [Chloroflexota bacterium]